MTTKNLKQLRQIHFIHLQDDSKFIHDPKESKKINLFQIQQQKNVHKPNPRQLMIQKLKSQTQQLKEMKRNISSVSMSRLSQMKKIINQNLNFQSQSHYRMDNKTDSQNDKYKFTKSIKDLVKMEKSDPYQKKDFINEQQGRKQKDQQSANNPQNLIPNNCLKKQQEDNQGQIENGMQKFQLQQKSPPIVINKSSKNIRLGHLRKISTESVDKIDPHNQTKNSFIRAQSQRRIRSSVSQFHRQRVESEMTLSVRKQLHQMQAKQKILKNKVRLIENQTEHKLNKKIKQNNELLEKHKGLYEIIQSRMEKQRQKTTLTRRRIQERRFVHQGKTLKVNIQRLAKRNTLEEEQQIMRTQSQESLLNLAYRNFLKEKRDLQKQQNLAYRLSFTKDFESKDLIASRISQRINSASRCKSTSTQYF